MEHLRHRTYLLEAQDEKDTPPGPKSPAPLIYAIPKEVLQSEIDRLPGHQMLSRSGPLEVWMASTGQIPAQMQEISRLREVTFRAVGEGTGEPMDLDEFDQSYLQLFIWNRKRMEIAGGCRMGLSDVILKNQGKKGFYTNRLFEYSDTLLRRISPGIELGRSFVCVDYQRSYLSLLLLWRGIGKFLALNLRFRFLFGAVSMSSEYSPMSRHLLVSHLGRNYRCSDLAGMVRPRNPIESGVSRSDKVKIQIRDLDELSNLIGDLEQDEKGLPVLFQKYLELGGRFLAFNLDPQFNNTLDGFMLVDLPQANRRLLEFYMGKEEAAKYIQYHIGEDSRPGVEINDSTPKSRGSERWKPTIPASSTA